MNPLHSRISFIFRISHVHALAAGVLLTLSLPKICPAEAPEHLRTLEQQQQALALKADEATVILAPPGNGYPNGASGVVVTAQGLILTAAHLAEGNERMDVQFPSGKKVHAKVLGIDYDHDLALMKIEEEGSYPFMEMGGTGAVPAGTPVLATGYFGNCWPGRQAAVRVGTVTASSDGKGIVTSCLIAPGDSGGPLFDMNGKVIGIHSTTEFGSGRSTHAPVSLARNNWNQLMAGERWGQPFQAESKTKEYELAGLDVKKFRQRLLQEAIKTQGRLKLDSTTLTTWLRECGLREEKISSLDENGAKKLLNDLLSKETDSKRGEKQTEPPPVAESEASSASCGLPLNEPDRKWLEEMLGKMSPSVVTISGSGDPLALGSIIRPDGRILTKWSEIKDDADKLEVRLSDGKILRGKIIRTWPEHDLAVVKIEASGLPVIDFTGEKKPLTPGSMIFSPGADAKAPLLSGGVISEKETSLQELPCDLGLILVSMEPVILADLADKANGGQNLPKMGDVLVSLNEKPIPNGRDLRKFESTLKSGDKVRAVYQRDGKSVETELTAVASQSPRMIGMDHLSRKPEGYPLSFENDQPLTPPQCGGPLVSVSGEVVGVNIARSGKPNSRAIPSHVIASLLKDLAP